jgi:hypothetical protein
MRKIFRVLSLALCLASNSAGAADLRIENPLLYAELRDTTFAPLFEALRMGDAAAITRYLSVSSFEKHRVLLEQNKEYGHFLRNYYDGATFELSQVLPSGNDYIADVLIYWPAGRTSFIQLQVRNTLAADQKSSVQSVQTKDRAPSRWTVGEPEEKSNSKRKR